MIVKIIYKGGEHRMDDDILLEEESKYVPKKGDIRKMNNKTARVRGTEIKDKNTIIVYVDLY